MHRPPGNSAVKVWIPIMYNDPHNGEETDLRQLPMLGFHEERRSFPRIDYRTDVIIASGDKVLGGRLRVLSAEGMQIRCTPQTARTLHPRGTRIAAGKGPTVMLRCDLTIGTELQTFTAQGKLTYITPRSREEIACGINFTRISLPDKKLLAAFIIESMRPG